jgi:hypothetical protein
VVTTVSTAPKSLSVKSFVSTGYVVLKTNHQTTRRRKVETIEAVVLARTGNFNELCFSTTVVEESSGEDGFDKASIEKVFHNTGCC